MDKAFVGRQPICRESGEVFAYELFSQNDELKAAAFTNGDKFTAVDILEEFIDLGLERVTGTHRAFVPVTRDFVISEYSSALPRSRVVLQMDGDTRPDNDVLGALLQLKSSGYAIALNNLVYGDEMRPIVERADIVKVNIRKLDRTAVSDQMKALKPFNTKLLAAEVETHEDYQFCKSLGFDYFEGYFFAKPQVSDQPIPSNRLSTLQLLSKLQDHEIGLAELEHVVGQDLAMSYRILRYLNSPMHALPRKIDSIRHAIALVGTGLIRQWASVIWLESIEDKPQELMNMALIRAHMCQQLANAMGAEGADQFFTVGLLSLLDALIDRPMVMVLEDLPLIEPVKDALLHRNGLMGAALNCAEAYERCEWERTSFADLNVQRIRDAYLNSIEWSRTALSELVN